MNAPARPRSRAIVFVVCTAVLGVVSIASADPMDPAAARRVCGTNPRCLQALTREPRTEPEWAMLAVACQFAHDMDCVRATMREYLRRYPNGPRAATFRAVLAHANASSSSAPPESSAPPGSSARP